MRLAACPSCHTQFDVSRLEEPSFPCPCGADVPNRPGRAVDAPVRRCGACGALVAEGADACEYCGSAIVRKGELSLLCPECYARNAEDSRFCTACGVEFRPQPVPSAAPEVACVRCGVATAPRALAGIVVYECRRCNGLWVPEKRFDALVDRAIEARGKAASGRSARAAPRRGRANPAAERVEYRKCPVCRRFMLRRNFGRTSGVIIDRCSEHGTWLDADELERIAGFAQEGGLDREARAEAGRAGTGRSSAASTAFWRILCEHRPVAKRHATILDALAALLSNRFH